MNTKDPIIFSYKPDAPKAAAEWLAPIAWQLFATLEFPWKARPETASRKFAKLVDTMEKSIRTRVCFVNATETRSKSGAIVPLHFHAAFTAARPISESLVAGIWNAGVGRSASEDGDLAMVKPYDRSRNGIGYILKMMSDPNCAWDIRNVHLFNPAIIIVPKTDHASLRSARRFHAQAAMGIGGLLRAA